MYNVCEVKNHAFVCNPCAIPSCAFFYRRYVFEKANLTLFMLRVSDIRQQKCGFQIKFFLIFIQQAHVQNGDTYIYIYIYIQNSVVTILVEVRIPLTIILEMCVVGSVTKI